MNAPPTAIAERGARLTAPGLGPVVTASVALWFAIVVAAHYAGLLRAGPGNLPIPFGVAITVPIAMFFASYSAVPRFRAAVRGVDLRLVTSLQAWRVAGFVFLPLLVFGHLPELFAWPAGLGDVAVGLAAPWIVWRVVKDASYATTRGFAAFHWLGRLRVVPRQKAGDADTLPGVDWDRGKQVVPGDRGMAMVWVLAPVALYTNSGPRRQGARYPDTTRLAMWTLKLMGSLLALMYLSAGWLKMVNGGLAWLDAFLDRVRHLISPVYFFRIPQSLSFSILGCAVRCLY